jgi:hypothetical protein
MRGRGGAIVLGLVLAAAPPAAEAAELVMFEERGCPWCARFDVEIGPIYGKTEEARRAPLRRVDLDGGMPAELAHLRPVSFTPTFVLLEEGREVGRIQGYPGEMHFWGLLGLLLERLPERAAEPAAAG